MDLFYLNDFNWNVAPSDETTREFHLVLDRVRPILDSHLFTFRFEEDAIELDAFVRKSLRAGTDGLSASLNVTRNRISCKAGVNHWIPFAESEVDAKDAYKSHFMVDFLKSILATKNTKDLCAPLCSLWLKNTSSSLPKDDLFATNDANELSSHQQFSIIHSQFSIDASRVMDAGRALWRYYHAQPSASARRAK